MAATYFTALMHGVSDSHMRLPDATAPIKERIGRLVYGMRSLTETPMTFILEPCVICSSCFEEAARIKRRVLAQGGTDHTFFEDICRLIDDDPTLDTSGTSESNLGHRQWLKPAFENGSY